MKILIGTPIHRLGAYALPEYLANQKNIQQIHPDCDLVFSTDDTGYISELQDLLHQWKLRGRVISHIVKKPGYAKSRIWNIASARESIRQYFLSQPEAETLLFLDSDMTYDPLVAGIMRKELTNGDAVFSGYRFRNGRIGLAGTGCLILKRSVLEKIKFRCYEFKNGQVINEDNVMEMDLFRQGCKIKKGFFLSIDHYHCATEAKHINPQKVGVLRKIMTGSMVRFCLIGTSIAVHYDIPGLGQRILWFLMSAVDKLRSVFLPRLK
jgi:hypothetical protein